MTNCLLSDAISAWSRETSLPANRRSFVSRRPIPKSAFEIGTIRRPRASVTSRRASGISEECIKDRIGWRLAVGSWVLAVGDPSSGIRLQSRLSATTDDSDNQNHERGADADCRHCFEETTLTRPHRPTGLAEKQAQKRERGDPDKGKQSAPPGAH